MSARPHITEKHVLGQFHLFAHPKRWLAGIARVLVLFPLIASFTAAQSNEPKRVLLLLQEDLSWPLFRQVDENVRATLLRGSPEGILIFSEHMNRAHFSDPFVQAQRAAGIQRKYASSKLDLVIEVGDSPHDLFPSVPLVHMSFGPRAEVASQMASPANDAAIWVELGVKKTVEAAQALQPNARQVMVIAGSSVSETAVLKQVREQLAGFSQQLQIVYLTNLGFPEICDRVKALGPESMVLFAGLARDGEGRPFIPAEAVGKIAKVSGAPVYALFNTHIGSGAVGGYVARFDEAGKQAAEMGLQFLAGQHPQDAMVRRDYVFDGRQLQRWKFSEATLPVGSIVLNRQPSAWEAYRWYILGAIFLGIAETLLVLGLLWQRARRKRSQHLLLVQMAFEKMPSELSTTFINLPEDQVEGTIEKSLSRISDFLKLDRITLFEYSPANKELRSKFSWQREEIGSVPAVINTDTLRWSTSLLMSGETLFASDLEALPEEAFAEKEHLRRLDTISVATVPLKAGEDFFGCVSFASTKRRVLWTSDLVGQLNLLAEILSNALMRKRAQEMRFRHAAVVESSEDAIISKTLDGTILSWNAGAERLFEFTEQEAVGQSITMLIPEELREEEEQILRRVNAGERIEHYETERVTKNGKKLYVSLTVSPVRNSAGVIEAASKIARDITEQKRAEQILRESEDRFRLVANSAPVLIWMASTDKLCNFFNQGWLNFTGRTLEQELGNGWAAGVHPDDVERCMRTYSRAFDIRAEFEMEYRLRRFDDEYRWLVDQGVPRFESDGTFRGYIGSCVDITERKASEEALHSLTGRLISAQEEERARIARELHDDFSQRMAMFGIGLGQLWKELPESHFKAREHLTEILRGVKEMSSDIHSLSHQLHSSKLEHVGLVPAIRALCTEISDKYSVEIIFSESGCPPDIPKDAALCLFRVTQEAIGNVVKHSGSSYAKVEVAGNGSGITLRITDAGRGFDPERPKELLGLGLVGMRERLRLVAGRLSVKSGLHHGTEILAEVPLRAPASGDKFQTQVAGR